MSRTTIHVINRDTGNSVPYAYVEASNNLYPANTGPDGMVDIQNAYDGQKVRADKQGYQTTPWYTLQSSDLGEIVTLRMEREDDDSTEESPNDNGDGWG